MFGVCGVWGLSGSGFIGLRIQGFLDFGLRVYGGAGFT